MKMYRWNGERWWLDDRGFLSRVRRWFFWSGGWESHGPKMDRPERTWTWTLRQRLAPRMLAPVSLLGHRFTYYSWGMQWRTRHGIWVWTFGRRLYRSYNGTPSEADVWVFGTPKDIVEAAEKRTVSSAKENSDHA
jgi:hypothetical protein